jgi:hypothetical protein
VCCALCAVCCGVCAVCCVLCGVCGVLCALCCVACDVCCVLCAVCFVLFAVCFVLCAVGAVFPYIIYMNYCRENIFNYLRESVKSSFQQLLGLLCFFWVTWKTQPRVAV